MWEYIPSIQPQVGEEVFITGYIEERGMCRKPDLQLGVEGIWSTPREAEDSHCGYGPAASPNCSLVDTILPRSDQMHPPPYNKALGRNKDTPTIPELLRKLYYKVLMNSYKILLYTLSKQWSPSASLPWESMESEEQITTNSLKLCGTRWEFTGFFLINI